MFECSTCAKSFTGQVSYDQHLASFKHKKKVSNLGFLNNCSGASTNLTNGVNGVTATESKSNEIMCHVCNLSFNSVEELISHALTREHALKVMQSNPNSNALSSSNSVETNPVENVASSTADEILPGFDDVKKVQGLSYNSCNVCLKRFSGPESYQQHINSELHKKKVELQNNAAVGVGQLFCETCKVSSSGQIPYLQHMNSEAHRKKLRQQEEAQKYMNEVDSSPKLEYGNETASGSARLWYCMVCQVQCSGATPYKQHLDGIAHYKNAKRAEALKNSLKPDSTTVGAIHSMPGSPGNALLPAVSSSERDNIKIENSIVPNLFDSFSTEKLESSIKIFPADEKIDFDKQKEKLAELAANDASYNNNNPEQDENESNRSRDEVDEVSGNIQLHVGEVAGKIDVDEKRVYRVCETCNLNLFSVDEVASHYESSEHVRKKSGYQRS